MPPLPLGLMIVEGTTASAFGARPFLFVFMGQVDVHLALFQLQFHALDSPGSGDAQNTAVQFGILHPQIVPWRWAVGHLQARRSDSPLSFRSGTGFAAARSRPGRTAGASEAPLDGEDRCEIITGRMESAPFPILFTHYRASIPSLTRHSKRTGIYVIRSPQRCVPIFNA